MIILGLGSNLPSSFGNKFENIDLAVSALDRYEVNEKHSLDESGKSKIMGYNYYFISSDYIQVACYIWSKQMNYMDHLRLSISKREFTDWRDK